MYQRLQKKNEIQRISRSDEKRSDFAQKIFAGLEKRPVRPAAERRSSRVTDAHCTGGKELIRHESANQRAAKVACCGQLLTRLIIRLSFLKLLHVLRAQLRPIHLDRQLVQPGSQFEGGQIVRVVDTR